MLSIRARVMMLVGLRAGPGGLVHSPARMKMEPGGTSGTLCSEVTGVVRKARDVRLEENCMATPLRGHGTRLPFSLSGVTHRQGSSVACTGEPGESVAIIGSRERRRPVGIRDGH